MASVQERLKLKRAPTDIWSIREQLCLASSVLKSGDQNWISVSRSLKPIADKDSIRSPDWFSQKSCVQQYAYLLENTDIPKRKKRESGETTSESIVRRLTQDRIAELTKILAAQREEYFQLRNEVNLLKNGTVSDEKLQKIWLAIEEEKKEQEQLNKIQISLLNKRLYIKQGQPSQVLNIQSSQKKTAETSVKNQEMIEINTENEEIMNKSGRSSLLTSLLKLQSSTTQIQTPTTASPTIASLLCSNLQVPEPGIVQNITQSHKSIPNTISNTIQERPSTTAPTLSMLLEQPSAGSQKALQQQLKNVSTLINSKNLQSPMQMQNTIQTRLPKLSESICMQIAEMQQDLSDADLTRSEIPQIISNPIDEVMPKVMQMDKDEINEIIGDIEELIKEEITGSPKTLDQSSETCRVIENFSVQTPAAEYLKPRNVNESVSLSDSPISEISIEEIDSSTSNIAEIIGTAIESVESKINVLGLSKETEKIKLSNNVDPDNKKTVKSNFSEEHVIRTEIMNKSIKESKDKVDNESGEVEPLLNKESSVNQEEIKDNISKIENDFNIPGIDLEKKDVQECIQNVNIIEDKQQTIDDQKAPTSEFVSISSDDDKTNDSSKQDKNEVLQNNDNITKNHLNAKEMKIIEDNATDEKIDQDEISLELKKMVTKNTPENDFKIQKSEMTNKKCEILEQDSNKVYNKNNQNLKETIKNFVLKDKKRKTEITEGAITEGDTKKDCGISNKKAVIENTKGSNDETCQREKTRDFVKREEIMGNNGNSKVGPIKIEPKTEDIEDNYEVSDTQEKEIKKEIESDSIKKENTESAESVEELDEEEPSSLSKLSGGRAMKTYSKKQNVTIDNEVENEISGETADYKSWKKHIMTVYNTLATHKYASVFLRPITEDQAPGYHSIIFRPMDLWTIKKNIDNGTIRSTAQFQRDVMLMFQNAIMFNKHNTFVHKMTLEMQEECLQHIQDLVQAVGEASFSRKTRTAASISNEAADSNLKRKWAHITSSPHEIESSRMKKRRKSEND